MRRLLFLSLLALASCARVLQQDAPRLNETANVAFSISGEAGGDIDLISKTYIGEDRVSVFWENTDNVFLWALDANDKLTLSGQKFSVFGKKEGRAFFTSTISSKMLEGEYEYWCCTPAPLNANGTDASFEIPARQDGRGEGIMIAQKESAGPLRPISEYVETEALSMKMSQMLHLLQLHVKDADNLLGGEKITKLTLSFPSNVVGTCKADISDPVMDLYLVNGSYELSVKPENACNISDVLYATILPSKWKLDDALGAKIYTQTKFAVAKPVQLKGRNMCKGHATPVCLQPLEVKNFCHFLLKLNSNPIGEDVTKITITAPSGCKWGDTGTNVQTIENAGGIPVGTSVEINYEEEALFRAMSGKSLTIQYESEHVIISQSMTVPNLSGKYSCDLLLNVPNLLAENFDNVPTFSSDDEYKTSKAGSYDPHSFLNGWSGGRIGAQAGKCIRIACRRETSADYDARVDSAPLNCTFKKATNINVAFSYGSNNQYGGIVIVTDGNVGQNCYVGYITTSKNYKSGDGDGTFDRTNNTFYTKEYTGSYTNTPNETDYTIKGIPAGASPVRITWHTEVEHQAGTTNTTAWLYLDNIKVTIAK